MPRALSPRFTLLALLTLAGLAPIASAADTRLSAYFGFDPMRAAVIDRGCGPMVVGDVNGDGIPDIVVVNNAKSRIELLLGRKEPKSNEELSKDLKANQLRPTAWADRKDVSISNRAGAVRLYDVDGDGKLDIIYAGASPSEIVILHQESDGTFKLMARHRIKGLQPSQPLLRIADVMGDSGPELIVLAEDKIQVQSLFKDASLGEPKRLGSGGQIAGLIIEDYDGNGQQDILGLVPEDPMPVRLFRQQQDPSRSGSKFGLLNSELRFESPPVRDADNARFDGRPGCSLGIVERASRRIVFYDFNASPIDAVKQSQGAISERETNAEVRAFADGNAKDRSVITADIDGDGLLDILATNTKSNTIDVYRQRSGVGPGDAEQFSAFKQPKTLAFAPAGAFDDNPAPTVFIMSEEEKSVGISRWEKDKLSFPAPVALKTSGATPAAIGYLDLDGIGTLAVVVKNKRDHTLELHQPKAKGPAAPAAELPKDAAAKDAKDSKDSKDTKDTAAKTPDENGVTAITLTNVSRPPQSMLAADVDQDGFADLLLFTPGEPMTIVRGGSVKGRPAQVLTSEQMPQFGLVQAATPDNSIMFDMDGDGKPELVIADKNFVRACKYDEKTGWKVLSQITVSDPGTDLVGLTALPATGGGSEPAMLVASDKGNGRLLFLDSTGVKRRVRLLGFTAGEITAGAFAGDKEPGILCMGDDAYAIVRLAGSKLKMEQFAAYRSDAPDRSEHQIAVGDVNGDGFLDAVVCDARDQTCAILTFSRKRNLLLATESKIFETRMFSGGDSREFEPRDTIVADVTGDGKNDIIMLVHDRILIYPQMTEQSAKTNPKVSAAQTDR